MPVTGIFHGMDQYAHQVFSAIGARGYPTFMLNSVPPTQGILTTLEPDLKRRVIAPPHAYDLPARIDRKTPANIRRWLSTAVAQRRFERTLAGLSPEVIIVNEFSGHRLLERYRSWPDIPRAMILHGSPALYMGHYGGRMQSKDELAAQLRHYDTLIAVSEGTIRQWRDDGLLGNRRTFVVWNCCDESNVATVLTRDRDKVRQGLGIRPDEFAVVCVGSIQYRKGQDLLLSQWPAIQSAVPSASLYLIGSSAPHGGGNEILGSMSSRDDEAITAVGHQDPGAALLWMYAADCLVVPSRDEAMPRVILEAMLLRTPVVAAEVAGVPEMIQHEQTGRLFRPDDPPSLAQQVSEVVQAADQTARCTAAAETAYHEKFARAHQLERWAQVLREM